MLSLQATLAAQVMCALGGVGVDDAAQPEV
jgi:hypothetical protein